MKRSKKVRRYGWDGVSGQLSDLDANIYSNLSSSKDIDGILKKSGNKKQIIFEEISKYLPVYLTG